MNSKKYNLAFFGTPTFSVPILKALLEGNSLYTINLVITQSDKPSGRGQKLTFSPIKELALQHGLNILQPLKIPSKKNPEEYEEFKGMLDQYGPFDAAVLVAYGQVLPEWILEYFHKHCINVHASLLPRWRGAAPIQRCLMWGDTVTGISLMNMDKGLDTGDVYSMEKVQINESITFSELHAKLSSLGAFMLVRDLPQILSGKLLPKPQSEEGLSYAHKIEAVDTKILWDYPAEKISRQIRALWPKPGAYTMLDGKRLKIAQVAVLRDSFQSQKGEYKPGEVLFVDKERCEVCCGKGTLALLSVQLEGKHQMSMSEFLNGHTIEKGAVLE
jgi:methionyl-tRNA formyltransferase